MKKYLYIVFIALLAISLVGCSKSNKKDDTTTAPVTSSAEETTGQITTNDTTKGSDDSSEPDPVTYTIVQKDFIIDERTQSDKTLIYPVFSGFADEEKTEALNNYIVQVCEEKYKEILPNINTLLEQEAYIDYKTEEAAVTCLTPDFVSIIVRGTVRVEIPFENPGNAEFFFTINIDLDTLEGLTSEEIVKDFDSLKSKFLKGDFRQIGGIEDVAKKTPLSDLIMRYRSEYQIYPYYYFTDTDFCMNLEVAGAPGWQSQCVQFALSISDAAPYLNTANKPVGALVSAANR